MSTYTATLKPDYVELLVIPAPVAEILDSLYFDELVNDQEQSVEFRSVFDEENSTCLHIKFTLYDNNNERIATVTADVRYSNIQITSHCSGQYTLTFRAITRLKNINTTEGIH